MSILDKMTARQYAEQLEAFNKAFNAPPCHRTGIHMLTSPMIERKCVWCGEVIPKENDVSENDLGPLPTIHPRERIVNEACAELDCACIDVRKKYDLTTGEYLRVLVHVINNTIGGVAKCAIRAERHPDDPDKPGGLV